MQAVILKCKPRSQFHFGTIALDENTSLDNTTEYLHSDTLFSAIINTIAKIYPQDTETWVKKFEQGSIQISSGYYCLELDEQWVYFLPKPVVCDLMPTKDAKKTRKIVFVSKAIWEQGIEPEEWITEKCVILQSKFVMLRSELDEKLKELKKLYHVVSIPKVFAHHLDQEDSLYYQTNVQMADLDPMTNLDLSEFGESYKVHFYFWVKHQLEEDDRKRFQAVLRVMAEYGVGGERSVGCGQFEEVLFPTVEIKLNQEAQQNCLLSLGIPGDKELEEFAYYKVLTRGGRATGRKISDDKLEKLKRVKMIVEGAVVKSEVLGKIVDLSPFEHEGVPYKRNGSCFLSPLHPNFKAPNIHEKGQ